jgi:hypothetical protein
MSIETKIKNSHLLTDLFGYWPSFHDAEVMKIILDREGNDLAHGPTIIASIYVFQMTSKVNNDGKYILKNHILADLRFDGVVELELYDFNHQNVLGELVIEDLSARQMERVRFEAAFHSIYGFGARFQCEAIGIDSVTPFTPQGPQIDNEWSSLPL